MHSLINHSRIQSPDASSKKRTQFSTRYAGADKAREWKMNHNGNQSYEWSHLGNNNKATLNHPLYPLRQTMRDCSPLSLIKSDFTFVARSRGNFPIAGQDFRPCNVTRCSSALCATNVNHSFTWFPVGYLSKWRGLIKTSAVLWSNSRNQSIGNRLIDTRFAWLINAWKPKTNWKLIPGGNRENR